MIDFGILALVGFGVALIVGLTGVGGGSIMTPLLITVFGVPAPVAVGTDLACAAVTKTAGSIAHRSARNIATRIVVLFAAGSVPAAITTLVLIAAAHMSSQQLNHLIRECVGAALLLSIGMLVLRDPLRRWGARSDRLSVIRHHRPAITVLVGAVIGVAVALTSLGAGAIGAACLALLYPELEPAEIAGSDIAHAVPLTAVATAGHAWLGTIDGGLLLALLCGGLPGIVLGSLASRRVPIRALRLMLMATLALAGVKLLA
ncbi:MAG TPA: sulfite exporter TauE/SafE family protein [Casimicrobiaceae bacterium]|nr:sulfite exporter TauE/SafE family protein [Casimicrobiaceae bacterium]